MSLTLVVALYRCRRTTATLSSILHEHKALSLGDFGTFKKGFILTHLSIKLHCISLITSFTAALDAWAPPLSTRGRYIVDAAGNRFKLKAGNWHGASGTWKGHGEPALDFNHHAGENAHNLPLGLQYIPILVILDSFESIGINTIRLPFSSEMVHDPQVVEDEWVQANPNLRGKTPLEVFDAVIEALTKRGFAVILNNHTIRSRWCCGVNDGNERWNESQTLEKWADMWLLLVRRYRHNKHVVGADLYNEVRNVGRSGFPG